jgi:hypothetical protein
MILLEDILKLHDESIKDFGVAKGIIDLGLLESALAKRFKLLVEKTCIQHPLKKLQLLEKV